MSGWIPFLALALMTAGLAVLVGRQRAGFLIPFGSALFVAAAGYAWQGSPGQAGAPAAGRVQHGLKPDTLFAIDRIRLLSPYGEAGQWLMFADGLNRAGEDQAAATALAGAVAKFPRDVALRLGYAHALLLVADDRFTPAVQLAYARAAAVAPGDPAVRYFEALGRLEAFDVTGALSEWGGLWTDLPANSPWRRVIAQRLAPLGFVPRDR